MKNQSKIRLTALATAVCASFTACGATQNDNEDYSTKSTTQYTTSVTQETTQKQTTKSQNIEHYCEATNCTNEGTIKYIGISGKPEYYCYTHYNELVKLISDMEEDVGKNNYSKHTCEVCSKNGTYSIIGFSGQTEYYCSEHYNELKGFLEDMLE